MNMTPGSFPLSKRILVFLILPAVIGILAVSFKFYSSIPADQGIYVADVSLPIQIMRDAHGVPHISAQTSQDAYFAMGYVHAQDRLWQMEMLRRQASGRLSEVLGKSSFGQDLWMRTLGLYRAAESSWDALSEDARSSLTDYARGVNSWISTSPHLPPEFTLLGIEPEPWTETDSLSIIKLFALSLSGNFDREIQKFIASQVLNEPQLLSLFGDYPEEAPVTVSATDSSLLPALRSLYGFNKEIERALNIGGPYVGSNAWIINGALTRSGEVILANDTHLPLQVPSLWYAVTIQSPALNVSGMSLAGLPSVILGHNASVAWGATNMMADVQDLYFEQIDPESPDHYLVDGSSLPFDITTEEIRIKVDFPAFINRPIAPFPIQIRKSRNGPIVSEIFGVFDQAIALRWTALNGSDTSYETFYRMNYARDWQSFKAAAAFHVAPVLNVIYGDVAGNIGFIGMGKVPIRSRGQGDLPVPGWTNEYTWTGYIPPDRMPQQYNPTKGYIVSANNQVVNAQYPYFISKGWAPPARASRIEDSINNLSARQEVISSKDMQMLQMDNVDIPALRLAQLLVSAETRKNGTPANAKAYLEKWDGRMSADSVGATIFHVWARHLRVRIFGDELDGVWEQGAKDAYLDDLVSTIDLDIIYRALTDESESWCSRSSFDMENSCSKAIHEALDDAIDEIEKLKGSNMNNWSWGSSLTALYPHTPFSNVRFLDEIFGRKIEGDGSPNSVNATNSTFDKSEGYIKTGGANFRQVIVLSPVRTTYYFMNSTGQSGHPMSVHFDDMIAPFRLGEFYTLDSGTDVPRNGTIEIRPINRAPIENP